MTKGAGANLANRAPIGSTQRCPSRHGTSATNAQAD
jgi:hypothetical protein